MHVHSAAPVLVESTGSLSVVSNPACYVWLGLVRAIDGLVFELIARCYYLARHHFRSRPSRPLVAGIISLYAADK